MRTRFVAILIVVVAAALPSCNPPAAVPPGGARKTGAAARAPDPYCSVESRQEHTLQKGTHLRSWDLKASGLKELRARILILRGGKEETAHEVKYEWPEWGPARPEATGRLLFLAQDGEPFGAKGKRLLLLGVDFQNLPSNSRIERRSGRFLEGELQTRMSLATNAQPLNRSEILYSELFRGPMDSTSEANLTSHLEAAIKESEKGGTIVAVHLEWAPQQ